MDANEARRQAVNIVSTAATRPGYKFTENKFRTCGADGPGGPRALIYALVDVAKELGAHPAHAAYTPGDTAAINELIAISCARLNQLGGDPIEHLKAISH